MLTQLFKYCYLGHNSGLNINYFCRFPFSSASFKSYAIECNRYIMFCCILPFQSLVVIMHMIELYRGKGLGARNMGCTATML